MRKNCAILYNHFRGVLGSRRDKQIVYQSTVLNLKTSFSVIIINFCLVLLAFLFFGFVCLLFLIPLGH